MAIRSEKMGSIMSIQDLFGTVPDGHEVPHEYGPSRVGHGEAQCIHCLGTNRENAVISPNHCEVRAKSILAEQTLTITPLEGDAVGAMLNCLEPVDRERFIVSMRGKTIFCWRCFRDCAGLVCSCENYE